MPYNNADWMREVENFSHRIKDYFENFDASAHATKQRREYPPVDLIEDSANLMLSFELPGMKKEEIQITMSGNHAVMISGTKAPDEISTGRKHTGERWYGNFNRAVAIPDGIEIDPSKVSATYTDGVLRITLPKAGSSAGRSIEII